MNTFKQQSINFMRAASPEEINQWFLLVTDNYALEILKDTISACICDELDLLEHKLDDLSAAANLLNQFKAQ